jgi:hypothetical protein
LRNKRGSFPPTQAQGKAKKKWGNFTYQHTGRITSHRIPAKDTVKDKRNENK